MKRVALHARGATVAFLTDELELFGEALAALIDSQDGGGGFTDDHMETLAGLHSKLRTALLLATARERLTVPTQQHLEKAEAWDLE